MVQLRVFASINCNGIRQKIKQNMLKSVLKDFDIDVCFLQEINDTNLSFVQPTYKYIANLGPSQRGTAIVYRDSLSVTDVHYEPSGRILSCLLDNIRLVNIYAPSGTQAKHDREHFFGEAIVPYLMGSTNTLLVGDFNCVLSQKDQTGTTLNTSFTCTNS